MLNKPMVNSFTDLVPNCFWLKESQEKLYIYICSRCGAYTSTPLNLCWSQHEGHPMTHINSIQVPNRCFLGIYNLREATQMVNFGRRTGELDPLLSGHGFLLNLKQPTAPYSQMHLCRQPAPLALCFSVSTLPVEESDQIWSDCLIRN